uniref:Uncharacterized protein n=1 Tax=Anguilla anguilla TaxID=7936 RepID=A0A0E9UVP9_ANGAN
MRRAMMSLATNINHSCFLCEEEYFDWVKQVKMTVNCSSTH